MRSLVLLLLLCLGAVTSASALDLEGVALPDEARVADHVLQLNGAGVRSKWFLDLYVASLYLSAPTHDAAEVVEQDRPLLLQLDIVSGLITSEKMEQATREGFEKAERAGYPVAAVQVDAFIDVFRDAISEGDRFRLIYLPESGMRVEKNGELKATPTGLAFKQALLAIWLGPDPAQQSLKRKLLGK